MCDRARPGAADARSHAGSTFTDLTNGLVEQSDGFIEEIFEFEYCAAMAEPSLPARITEQLVQLLGELLDVAISCSGTLRHNPGANISDSGGSSTILHPLAPS